MKLLLQQHKRLQDFYLSGSKYGRTEVAGHWEQVYPCSRNLQSQGNTVIDNLLDNSLQ